MEEPFWHKAVCVVATVVQLLSCIGCAAENEKYLGYEPYIHMLPLHTHVSTCTCTNIPTHSHTYLCACMQTSTNLQQNQVQEKFIWMSYKKKSLEMH